MPPLWQLTPQLEQSVFAVLSVKFCTWTGAPLHSMGNIILLVSWTASSTWHPKSTVLRKVSGSISSLAYASFGLVVFSISWSLIISSYKGPNMQGTAKAPFIWARSIFLSRGLPTDPLLSWAELVDDRSVLAPLMQSGHRHSPLSSMGSQM